MASWIKDKGKVFVWSYKTECEMYSIVILCEIIKTIISIQNHAYDI